MKNKMFKKTQELNHGTKQIHTQQLSSSTIRIDRFKFRMPNSNMQSNCNQEQNSQINLSKMTTTTTTKNEQIFGQWMMASTSEYGSINKCI